MKPHVIVIGGVAGCGKTTVGRELADRLGCGFVDADDYHPPGNRARMNAGIALTDYEHRLWLEALAPVVGRLRARQGHFFNPVLVRSPFEALELPADEPGPP
jgi:gluconokinase